MRRYNLKTKKENVDTEPFEGLSITAVPERQDLHTLLDANYGWEKVEDIETRTTSFSKLPLILHISVDTNVAKDPSTGLLKMGPGFDGIPDDLYMDRYVDNVDEINERTEYSKSRIRLEKLIKRREKLVEKTSLDLDAADTLDTAGNYVEDVLSDMDTLEIFADLEDMSTLSGNLHQLADVIRSEELPQLDENIQAERQRAQTLHKDLFLAGGALHYRLHAICVHIGASAASGHYTISIRDHKTGVWFSFNDETVRRETNMDAIYSPGKSGEEKKPALLVYVRDESMQDLIETVHRMPETEPADQPMLEQPTQEVEPAPSYAGSLNDNAQGLVQVTPPRKASTGHT